MVEIRLSDIELNDDFCDIYFQDAEGCGYRFRADTEKGKIISLLAHGVYLPNNNIYDLFGKLLELTGLYVHSVTIIDGYKNRAIINISDTNQIRSLPISIDDALIIGLFFKVPIYLKREACFLEFDNLDKYIWYRLLKELDLC